MKPWKEYSPLAKRIIVYFALMMVMVVAVAVWLHEPAPQKRNVQAQVEEQAQMPSREVILYFGLTQEPLLYPETRQVEGCEADTECVKEVVAALAAGPDVKSGLVKVLPEGTLLRNVEISEDLVTLDFNTRLVNGHPGGSLSELLTVYALVDTIAANFPHLRQVQLLIEGQPQATLKGHVEIATPVKADFSWTSNPEEEELTIPVRGGEDE